MSALAQPLRRPPILAGLLPFYYGWINVLVAAFAMVATLPGRTQGLGLITESLLRDLSLGRSEYARINLWATLIGASVCVGFGRLVDYWGNRVVLTSLSFALGLVVLGLSRVETVMALAIAITLTRVLGQSALSVSSLSVPPQWFTRRLPMAMAGYTVVLSVGFMLAFPLVGAVVTSSGWRTAWGGIGWVLILGMAPLAWFLVRRSPEECGLPGEPMEPVGPENKPPLRPDFRLVEALKTPLFWVFASGSSLYGMVASGIGLFNESILQERGFDSSAYHLALGVTALTALVGNFLGGWLAIRWSMARLMAGAMALLAAGLLGLPHLRSQTELVAQAILMGLAGGLVAVLFFTVWGRAFGRQHLGQIQGAAQALTIIGSAAGPLLLAEVVSVTGSYSAAFYGLATAVAAVGGAALWLAATGGCRRCDPEGALK